MRDDLVPLPARSRPGAIYPGWALPPLFHLGSASSFGIDLSDFGLLCGADTAKWPDAAGVVVERS